MTGIDVKVSSERSSNEVQKKPAVECQADVTPSCDEKPKARLRIGQGRPREKLKRRRSDASKI